MKSRSVRQKVSHGARPNFEAKAIYLEKLAREGVPPNTYVPRNISQVARWEDSALGFIAWRKPNIHSPNGKYGDIRLRVDVALKIIFPEVQPSAPEPSVDANKTMAAMVGQIATFRQEIIRLQEELQTQKEQTVQAQEFLAKVEQENSALKKTLQTIKPLHSVRPRS